MHSDKVHSWISLVEAEPFMEGERYGAEELWTGIEIDREIAFRNNIH